MTGICIISFDCEGKWGLADTISQRDQNSLTKKNILNAYLYILNSLEKYKLQSTFSFVGAFTLNYKYFIEKWLPVLKLSDRHNNWLSRFTSDFIEDKADSWFYPELINLVKASNLNHEISSHGFTHLPFRDAVADSIDIEIDGILDWMLFHNITISTFIFPRNLLKYAEKLIKLNIIGYRTPPDISNNRLLNFLYEFYPFPSSQIRKKKLGLFIEIPGNFFLNWRFGYRRFIPIWLTVFRFRYALKHAHLNNGVVHLWMHPHNLITGINQMQLFEKCIEVLYSEIQKGRISLMTQNDYCRDESFLN
jgi:hypothetical protein